MKKKIFYIVFIFISFIFVQGKAQSLSSGSELLGLNAFTQEIDQTIVSNCVEQIPLIGLSTYDKENSSVATNTYIQSIIRAGGAPLLVPVTTDIQKLRAIVDQLDGLILTGGADVNPLWYGEQPINALKKVEPKRDKFELALIKLATDRNVPVLGVCRGCQLLNVAFGGSLYQDIPSQYNVAHVIKHVQQMSGRYGSHLMAIDSGSVLAKVISKDTILVNSFHHQAVKELAPGFKITARAPDGIVEAIEAYPVHPIIGVQFHPEIFTANGDTTALKIFSFIVKEAKRYRQAKIIHKHIYSLDTHTDTPLQFHKEGYSLGERESNRVNVPKMREGRLDATFLAVWLQQRERDEVSSKAATQKAFRILDEIYRQIALNKNICGIASTHKDLERLKAEGKKAFFIGIENGYAIGKDLSLIAVFKAKGVNYITLCHSYDNDICDSSTHTKKEWGGLSPFGKQVVAEMNKQGVMIDLSHASENTFWQVLKLSKVPVICSHSSSKAVRYCDRNLTDDQLKALAEKGGVAQVCVYDHYLKRDYKKATIQDVVDHINHMVKIAGIDHVGFGSDFDGGGGVAGLNGDNDVLNLTMALLKEGYTEKDLAKFWGGNLLRVMDTVQAAAE